MYRVEKYIERCLKSIGEQDIPGGAECLIIDDCSPDNSRAIAENFINSYNGPITFRIITHEANGGLSNARNTGIQNAHGKYMMFIDSDDFIAPNCLYPLVLRMQNEHLDCLNYKLTIIGNSKRSETIIKRPSDYQTITNIEYLHRYYPSISSCSNIVLREKVSHLRFTPGVVHEDYAYVLQLYCNTHQIGFTDSPVYFYDIKENGTISTARSLEHDRRYITDWVKELKMLYDQVSSDKISTELYAGFKKCLTDYNYAALTCLLKSNLPKEEKLHYFKLFKTIPEIFKYKKNHLNLRRKIRLFFYCIPGIYPVLLNIFNKK